MSNENVKQGKLYDEIMQTISPSTQIRILLDEAKAEFPKVDKYTESIKMVQYLFPDSHAFSKRFIIATLQIAKEATEKWFGE